MPPAFGFAAAAAAGLAGAALAGDLVACLDAGLELDLLPNIPPPDEPLDDDLRPPKPPPPLLGIFLL